VNCGFGSGTQGQHIGHDERHQVDRRNRSITYASGRHTLERAHDRRLPHHPGRSEERRPRGRHADGRDEHGDGGYPDIGSAQHLDSGGAAGMLYVPNLDGV